ncbi:unnamed protein product [Bursaphelenchus okinawaensis]|uniref:Uncharacterized protein n=1 Tax=Bursaphelenchus okinawaensis TaxID=465554 RepID=A0A811JV02_9BILA|nr:unnamed protein product [Bursaphelenchus okinawaensis]CAG9084333.1 unnamed protein product [Bursaphelenchus okinawaensis]
MLAARGVSLGLGKINLSELNQLPAADRALLGKIQKLKKKAQERPKLIVKKHVDRKTLWAACRAVVIGAIIICLGLFMTVLGYFDRDLTTSSIYNMTTGDEIVVIDASLRYKLKSMQYVGPVLMGLGTFLLIIACVITLESRDRHAQIIQEESSSHKNKREMINSSTKFSLLPNDTTEDMTIQNHVVDDDGLLTQRTDRPSIDSDTEIEKLKGNNILNQQHVEAEVHRTLEDEDQPGPSARKTQSFRECSKKNGGQRLSLQKPPLPESGLLLSTVHLKKPKGPAPIAHFDSQLEIPLSSASCSTLGTNNYR